MATKSIIDIEVQDQDFKNFLGLFQKYQAEVAKLPKGWNDIGKEIKNSASGFGDIVAALTAQAVFMRQLSAETDKVDKSVTRQASSWKNITASTKTVAGTVLTITRDLLKWAEIGSVFTGLLGGGGLLGLNRLAGNVTADRRYALGLGTSYGEQKAFDLDYGRFVDPGQFLGGINNALHDVSQRWRLSTLGISQQEIAGGNTAQIGSDLLLRLKDLADNTNPALYAQTLQSRGLYAFASVNDLTRLHGMSRQEVLEQQGHYLSDKGEIGLSDDTLKKWNNLSTQLDRAKVKIETVLVDGLTPLAQPLEHLSDSVTTVVKNLLVWAEHSGAIDKFATGIESFATYLGSDDFSKKMDEVKGDFLLLGRDTIALASAMHQGLVLLGIVSGDPDADTKKNHLPPNPNDHGNFFQRFKGHIEDTSPELFHRSPLAGGAIGFQGLPSSTNPGNLRGPGGTGYQIFNNADEGLVGMANQLLRYEYSNKFGHLDTLSKIISTYAPPSDHNNTAAYIKDVAKRTGLDPNKHIDLSDRSILAEVMAAMTHHENSKTHFTKEYIQADLAKADPVGLKKLTSAINKKPPSSVKITVSNATGGNTNITVSALGAQ